MALPRLAITAAVVIWLMMLSVLQVFTAVYARTYRCVYSRYRAEMPPYTKNIGMPVIGHGDLSDEPETWPYYAVRALLVIPPLQLLMVMWWMKNREHLMMLLVFTLPAYIALVTLVVVLVAGSLWLPNQWC